MIKGRQYPKRVKEDKMTTLPSQKQSRQNGYCLWKEVDNKTFGKGFDCFLENATCHMGVAEWKGREMIRESLRTFINNNQFTVHHHIIEYWDGTDQSPPRHFRHDT